MSEARRLFRDGKRAEALVAARREYDPTDAESRLLLGLIGASVGEVEEAAEHLEAVLKPGQGQAQHWRVLAAVRGRRGEIVGEAQALAQAVALAPADPAPRLQLASAWLEAGDRPKALLAAIEALKLDDSIEARRLFVEALPGTDRTDSELRGLVKRALREAWGNQPRMSGAAVAIIRARALPPESDDLLAELLVSGPIQDPQLERELTAVRRRRLLEGGGPARFLEALATQGHINEYCWSVSDEEAQALAALAPADPLRALYEDTAAPAPAVDIPVLTPVRPGVSEAVQEMYEQNPYPRWVRMPEQRPQPLDALLKRLFPLAQIAPVPDAEVLIAGCGTGQHPIRAAKRYLGARVLAVDLSRTSLAYAMARTAALGMDNIAYGQADLLELGALGRTFGVIECSGVLHHLADPAAGLAVLTGLLRPGGVMHLGLYSATARRPLDAAKAFAAEHGYGPGLADIRRFRRAILEAPAGDPVRAVLAFGDFYGASSCRDLLFHVQEHRFDLQEVEQLLGDNGLTLIGLSVDPDVRAAYRREHRDDPAGTSWANWAAFEAKHPETFVGMYRLWVQKPA